MLGLDGVAGITFNDASVQGASALSGARVFTSKMPAGTVIQTVSFVNNTQNSSSSTSWVATTVTMSITPTSANSKILAMALGGTLDNNGGTNSQCYLTFFRNGTTNLGNTNYGLEIGRAHV